MEGWDDPPVEIDNRGNITWSCCVITLKFSSRIMVVSRWPFSVRCSPLRAIALVIWLPTGPSIPSSCWVFIIVFSKTAWLLRNSKWIFVSWPFTFPLTKPSTRVIFISSRLFPKSSRGSIPTPPRPKATCPAVTSRSLFKALRTGAPTVASTWAAARPKVES